MFQPIAIFGVEAMRCGVNMDKEVGVSARVELMELFGPLSNKWCCRGVGVDIAIIITI